MIEFYTLFQIEMAELGRDRDLDYDPEWEYEQWLFKRLRDDKAIAKLFRLEGE